MTLAIPHAPPMRFISSVVLESDRALVSATVPCTSPACRDKRVRRGYLVELAAQAAAAEAAARATGGAAIRGALVGIKHWRIVDEIAADTAVSILLRTTAQLGQLRQISASIACGERMIAHGELQISELRA
jgi:predicted hotdog family 3-hydroxylacyl-ACP dehydratase